MDKLRAIKFYCRTVETKSFTSAARALDVPPSVLSKTIAALERELQLRLLNRSTRRLALTEAGAEYYGRCRQLLLDVDEAETVAKRGTVEPAGTLRVGIHPVFQISLCRRICEFLAANPEVRVEISHTNAPANLLEQGLDLVLRVGPLESSSFVARRLGVTDLLTCAAPAYLDAHGRPSHPRDLAKHRAIVPGRQDENSFARWRFFKGRKRETVSVPASLILVEGVGLGIAAVGGIGVVRMYDIAARPFIDDRTLEPVLQDWSADQQPVHAVIPDRHNVPAKVRAFIDFARSLVLK